MSLILKIDQSIIQVIIEKNAHPNFGRAQLSTVCDDYIELMNVKPIT